MFLPNKNLLQFSRIAFLGSEVVSDNMIYAREAQTQKDRFGLKGTQNQWIH